MDRILSQKVMGTQIEEGHRSRIGLLVELLDKVLEHPEYGASRLQYSLGINSTQWSWALAVFKEAGLANVIIENAGQKPRVTVTGKGLEMLRRYKAFLEFVRNGSP